MKLPAFSRPGGMPERKTRALLGGLAPAALATFVAVALPAAPPPTDGSDPVAVDSLPGRSPAIRSGEKLTYSVRYGMVKAGTAVLEVFGPQSLKGQSGYHVVATTLSNPVFDRIYPVRDRVESFMDDRHLYSLYFEKHLREGNYKADQAVHFDQGKGTATYQDGSRYPIPAGTFDVLSAFYKVRASVLKIGERIRLDSHADRENYPIEVDVQAREDVDTPAGRFTCLRVEPRIASGTFFKNEGKLTIWLTDDARRIPVQMRSKIPVGSITVVLTNFVRPGERGGEQSAASAPAR